LILLTRRINEVCVGCIFSGYLLGSRCKNLGFWLRTYHSFTNNRLAAANGYPEGHQDKHPGSVEAISRSRHPWRPKDGR